MPKRHILLSLNRQTNSICVCMCKCACVCVFACMRAHMHVLLEHLYVFKPWQYGFLLQPNTFLTDISSMSCHLKFHITPLNEVLKASVKIQMLWEGIFLSYYKSLTSYFKWVHQNSCLVQSQGPKGTGPGTIGLDGSEDAVKPPAESLEGLSPGVQGLGEESSDWEKIEKSW